MTRPLNHNHQNENRPIVLQTKQLSRRFGNLLAVDNLDLTVYHGEIFGLLGPNGAGKSTTINMICGLIEPNAGKIYLFNQEMQFGNNLFKTKIGVCPQEIIIWPKLTCLEQLELMGVMYRMTPKSARERGKRLLDELGLLEKGRQLASTLSGGMLRRLNLALALVHDPELLILDEPEAGLDPQSRVLVREYIRSLAKQKTIIFTTHNMDEADRVCDRVAIVDHGKLLQLDTPEHLKHSTGTGTVLEILISENNKLDQIIKEIEQMNLQVVHANQTLLIRSPEVLTFLPSIIDRLKALDLAIQELKLRENTLEDVFILLTGRRLRE
ncbi:ABC transporter ATP-binding protein [candidate division KSB1 bacterium]|nr:ABC transporter ATP-binding protein [candidate division KSB1 bacterium]